MPFALEEGYVDVIWFDNAILYRNPHAIYDMIAMCFNKHLYAIRRRSCNQISHLSLSAGMQVSLGVFNNNNILWHSRQQRHKNRQHITNTKTNMLRFELMFLTSPAKCNILNEVFCRDSIMFVNLNLRTR